jgi:hypothetical protein
LMARFQDQRYSIIHCDKLQGFQLIPKAISVAIALHRRHT